MDGSASIWCFNEKLCKIRRVSSRIDFSLETSDVSQFITITHGAGVLLSMNLRTPVNGIRDNTNSELQCKLTKLKGTINRGDLLKRMAGDSM